MKITTCHEFPPIPDRSSDWSAVDSDTYDVDCDEDGYFSRSPIGRGRTEQEAVDDLLAQLFEQADGDLEYDQWKERQLGLIPLANFQARASITGKQQTRRKRTSPANMCLSALPSPVACAVGPRTSTPRTIRSARRPPTAPFAGRKTLQT